MAYMQERRIGYIICNNGLIMNAKVYVFITLSDYAHMQEFTTTTFKFINNLALFCFIVLCLPKLSWESLMLTNFYGNSGI